MKKLPLELSFEGKAEDGDILVVDGAFPNFRTEKMPAYVQTFPKVPRLEKGQKAILVYEGNEIKWHVKDAKGISRSESAGTSFFVMVIGFFIYKWFTKNKGREND